MTAFVVAVSIVAGGLSILISLGGAYLNICGPVTDRNAPNAR